VSVVGVLFDTCRDIYGTPHLLLRTTRMRSQVLGRVSCAAALVTSKQTNLNVIGLIKQSDFIDTQSSLGPK